MECAHAYFEDGIEYVLCDKEGRPKSKRLDEITKFMCGYQRFCPNVRACTLLPEWRDCSKLRVAEKPVEKSVLAVAQKAKSKKKA